MERPWFRTATGNVSAMLLAFGAVLAAPAATVAAPTPAACSPSWSFVDSPNPSPSGGDNVLQSVYAGGPDDVWAVGYYLDGGRPIPLIERFDGVSWTAVPAAGDFENGGQLNAVTGTGPSDVWAVGWASIGSGPRTLVEHWDGSQWAVIPSPSHTSASDALTGVFALAPDDVWAVGYSAVPSSIRSRTLVEHWDGSTWRAVPTPAMFSQTQTLYGVYGGAPDDVWAVGYYVGDTFTYQPLREHWDGARWRAVRGPDTGAGGFLFGIGGTSATDVWAVGGTPDGLGSLIEHWDGSRWRISLAPRGDLHGVVALSPGDAWAVGSDRSQDDGNLTFVRRWDQGWTYSASPSHTDEAVTFNYLLGVSAASAADVWAVGYYYAGGSYRTLIERICPVQATDSGFSPQAATAVLGSTVAWSVPSEDAGPHGIVDGTGMGLFDSGLRAPGSSFDFRFTGAGTYPTLDPATAVEGSIGIPVALPASATVGTPFRVKWATRIQPSGFAFDVQVKAPGASSWSDVARGTRLLGHDYTASVAGVYRFRARMHSAGGASGFSPSASLTVSAA